MRNDVRYAVRSLLRSPGYAIVAILCLSLGIAANVTVFTPVNTLLLRPLPFAEPDRVVRDDRDRRHRDHDHPDREQRDRAGVAAEIAQRREERRAVEQRRQEQQQDEVRLELDLGHAGHVADARFAATQPAIPWPRGTRY